MILGFYLSPDTVMRFRQSWLNLRQVAISEQQECKVINSEHHPNTHTHMHTKSHSDRRQSSDPSVPTGWRRTLLTRSQRWRCFYQSSWWRRTSRKDPFGPAHSTSTSRSKREKKRLTSIHHVSTEANSTMSQSGSLKLKE